MIKTHIVDHKNLLMKMFSNFEKLNLTLNDYFKELAPSEIFDIDTNQTFNSTVLQYLFLLSISDGDFSEKEYIYMNEISTYKINKEDMLKIHLDYLSEANIQLLYDGKHIFITYLEWLDKKIYDFRHIDEEFSVLNFKKSFFEFTNQLFDDFISVTNQDEKVLQTKIDLINAIKPLDNLITSHDHQGANDTIIIEENMESLEELILQLDNLVGLGNVKKEVKTLFNLINLNKHRADKGLPLLKFSNHLVFYGNPGTGKTTVARLISKIYKKMGILTKGHLIETDRSGLVGGYVGQTALKVKEVIDKAYGGILFIDEAYTLSNSSENDYGQEAINTLLKAMEDNRDNLIIIVAGYPDLMHSFLYSNPGLKSRFNKLIHFEDYSVDELYSIFRLMLEDNGFNIQKEIEYKFKDYYTDLLNNLSETFSNAREIRNLFELCVSNQANRLSKHDNISDYDLQYIILQDFPL